VKAERPDTVAGPDEGRQKRSWFHESVIGRRLSKNRNESSRQSSISTPRKRSWKIIRQKAGAKKPGLARARNGPWARAAGVIGERPAGRSAARLCDPDWLVQVVSIMGRKFCDERLTI